MLYWRAAKVEENDEIVAIRRNVVGVDVDQRFPCDDGSRDAHFRRVVN